MEVKNPSFQENYFLFRGKTQNFSAKKANFSTIIGRFNAKEENFSIIIRLFSAKEKTLA